MIPEAGTCSNVNGRILAVVPLFFNAAIANARKPEPNKMQS